MKQASKVRALVYTDTGIHSEDGMYSEQPAGALWDPAGPLALAERWFDGSGTILIPEDWHNTEWHKGEWSNRWLFTVPTGEPAAWTTFRRSEDDMTVHIGIRSRIDQDRTPLFRVNDQDPYRVAGLLALYHQVMHEPFHATPGVCGVQVLRSLFSGRPYGNGQPRQPLWFVPEDTTAPDGTPLLGAGDIMWHREPTEVEIGMPYSHRYDVNAMYLAAAGLTQLGWTDLRYSDWPMFNANIGGFWKVAVDKLPAWCHNPYVVPLVNLSRVTDDEGWIWLGTPTMQYLQQIGKMPPPAAGMLPARSSALLKGWAQHVNTARQKLALMAMGSPAEDSYRYSMASATVKRSVNEAIGLFNRPGGRVYRPDWRRLIIEQARVNMVRKLDQVRMRTGRSPYTVKVDAVTFAGLYPDGVYEAVDVFGIPIDPGQLGAWKHEETVVNPGAGQDDGKRPTCFDCAAKVGEPHADNCDVASCVVTGGQRLSCMSDHDHGADVWRGAWPERGRPYLLERQAATVLDGIVP